MRGTKDADANWRAPRSDLEKSLSTLEDLDLDDWFGFTVGDARPLQGEGSYGALRYPVTAKLDGRVFDQLSLDVNIVGSQDARPVELVVIQRNPFKFVDEPVLVVPMVTPGQQLAEKLHAYTRRYADEPSSRAKDLFDMLVIADQVQLPSGVGLTSAVQDTFRVRATGWPPDLTEPPAERGGAWAGFIADYSLPWGSLTDASIALRQFWDPILTGSAAVADLAWRKDLWRWI